MKTRCHQIAGIIFLLAATVLPLRAANVLSNPDFETGDPGGWTTYGANNYVLSNPGIAHGGNDYIKVYQTFNGQINYNGVYQDNVSGPGMVYSADGWAYTLSSDLMTGQNVAWIEVTFRDTLGNVLALYRSAPVTTNNIITGAFPENEWVNLPVTNQYDPNLYVITNTVNNLVAPPGTSFVRYQVVFQGDQYNSGGSMYFDDLTLNQTSQNAYGPGWNLVWSDEFNGNCLNTNNWTYDIGNGFESGGYYVSGWGNNELEYYTSNAQNVSVTNGMLHIMAQKQPNNGLNYTSGRIKSLGLFATTYGRIEWRAKLPQGMGFWPALWMLPTHSPYGAWPNSGEIDVVENKGNIPTREGGTIHYGGVGGNDVYSGKTYTFLSGDSATNFHTYLLEWSTNAINWYVDGHLYENQKNWFSNIGTTTNTYPYPTPFNQPFYILMNLAIGGNYLTNPPPSLIDPNLPGEMEVDYVRVYEQATATEISTAILKGGVTLSQPTQTNLLHLALTPTPASPTTFYGQESPQ
jgi:beta-glucanase (GH16 family)